MWVVHGTLIQVYTCGVGGGYCIDVGCAWYINTSVHLWSGRGYCIECNFVWAPKFPLIMAHDN